MRSRGGDAALSTGPYSRPMVRSRVAVAIALVLAGVAGAPLSGWGQEVAEDATSALEPGPTASSTQRLARTFAALRRHELDNGVHVVLDPYGATQLVTVAVSVSVGSRDQPVGWTGLAHLAEHLMFRARASQPVHFVDRMERLGALVANGMTERDRTVYFETVPTAALDEVLWSEAERFAHVLGELDVADVAQEREIVLRERAIREANRDERHYADPDRFDLHRKNDDHLAFGFGSHFCAGSHLALLEARTALNALLDRLPNLRLDPDQESAVVGLAFRSPNRLPVRFDARH